jgi:hypothetical protein
MLNDFEGRKNTKGNKKEGFYALFCVWWWYVYILFLN